MFIKTENNYKLSPGSKENVQTNLPKGMYNMEVSRSMFGSSISFKKIENFSTGSIIRKGIFKEIWGGVDNFISKEMERVRSEMKLQSKVGYIFSGEPGTGKSYLARQIAEYIITKRDAVGIIANDINGINLNRLITEVRVNDKNRFIVMILDEFEKLTYDMTDMLSFLEVSGPVDNIMVIATVNEMNKLPLTLIKRPGRFENIFNFKMDNINIISVIASKLIPEHYINNIDITKLSKHLLSNKKIVIDAIRTEIKNMLHAFEQKQNNIQERITDFDVCFKEPLKAIAQPN